MHHLQSFESHVIWLTVKTCQSSALALLERSVPHPPKMAIQVEAHGQVLKTDIKVASAKEMSTFTFRFLLQNFQLILMLYTRYGAEAW